MPWTRSLRQSRRTIRLPNTEALGHVLYTRYIYFFQTAGVILLVAMIGAIVLHAASQAQRQAAEHLAAGRAHPGGRDRGRAGPAGAGAVMTVSGSDITSPSAAILFTIGIFGIFLNRKNVIVILMSIELILLAVNMNFVAFSTFLGDLVGQVFALVVLTVAAAEAAIGLAILVV